MWLIIHYAICLNLDQWTIDQWTMDNGHASSGMYNHMLVVGSFSKRDWFELICKIPRSVESHDFGVVKIVFAVTHPRIYFMGKNRLLTGASDAQTTHHKWLMVTIMGLCGA